ncbi:MAG: type II secretion system F family protein [Firmicutes bacterium]|nr:type II secretion system F family protein [Bacillota bacterium]
MVVAITVLSFASAFSLVYWALCPSDEAESVRQRLESLRAGDREQMLDPRERAETALPFRQRVVAPVLDLMYAAVLRWAPGGIRRRMAERLEKAGKPFEAGRLFALKVLFAATMPLGYMAIIAAARPASMVYRGVTAAACLGVLGYILPDFYLSRLISSRKSTIRAALPDVLDLLTVSVEAGLGFDGAMQKVSERFKGPVSNEFREFLKEVRLGKSRVDALRSMSDRIDIDDLKTFVASIVQAEQLGVSLARVLRVQSDQMRIRRKQRAEEQAMQTPIKMLFPLVLFVFPTIFVVLLGPIVIHVLPLLGKFR